MRYSTHGKVTLVLVILTIALAYLIAWVDRPIPAPPVQTMIPPPPDSTDGWYYSFHKHEWRKIFRSTPRANEVNSSSEAYKIDEDDIQEYLEKKVDGYLEDTYWGEEYDISDKN